MVYDQDGNLIFEADGATGEMLREYVWLQGRPVAVIDAAADSAIYAVHVDHLDRPVMMTDYSRAIVWRADYLPFGEVRTSSGPASLAYRFPGQWFMLETGLHYNWHRWYDASTGRYTQPDPIGMPDGPSRYAYALNSPLGYVDPSGLAEIPPSVPPDIPGGPWTEAAGQKPGTFFGPKQPSGPRWICRWVPPFPEGPPGSQGYWKTQAPGQSGWSHFNQSGQPITPEEAHPNPLPRFPIPRPGFGLPVPLILDPCPILMDAPSCTRT